VAFEDENHVIHYGRIIHFLHAKISGSHYFWAYVKVHELVPNQLQDHHYLYLEEQFVYWYITLQSIKSKAMMCTSAHLPKWNGHSVGYLIKPVWTTTQL